MSSRIFLVSACLLSCCPHAFSDSATHAPWFSGENKAAASELRLPSTIRVGLLHSRSAVTLGCSGKYSYVSLNKGKAVTLSPGTRLTVKGSRHGLIVGKKTLSGGLLVAATSSTAYLTVNGRPYRGSLTLKSRSNGVVDVIEQVDLEEYLYGVLPREVGADWPAESLKAQAVVSRTFVVANLGKYANRGYDVTSDVYSQVYGGLQDESPATNQAVEATRGEILVDARGTPIQAFFHSSCGGETENPAYVWKDLQDPPEYLQGVKDDFCKEDPFYHWHLDIPADTLRRRLSHAGFSVGTPTKISIAKRSPSGRAWMISVDSSRGRKLIQGNSFRLAVGPEALRSTLLTDIEKNKSTFHFEGQGWGHGVGLCQWGARGRALAGHSYAKILGAYYPHTRLLQASEQNVVKAAS